MRGKHAAPRPSRRTVRLIPARAGKTGPHLRAHPHRPAHPRACGENALTIVVSAVTVGSSPRVRGKRVMWCARMKRLGLIPARAGKTGGGRCRAPAGRAHPRACGENCIAFLMFTAPLGSSPRVRGKRVPGHPHLAPARLIPARAGKTTWATRGSSRRWAHPRAYGENGGARADGPHEPGSSPRVRGKRPRGLAHRDSCGLIPARAGKTAESGWARSCGSAHPRACGENPRVIA